MRYIIYVFILLCNLIHAQPLRVGLFRASELSKLSLLNSTRELLVETGTISFNFWDKQDFVITASGNEVFLDAGFQRIGKFKSLKFSTLHNQTLTIDCIHPDLKELSFNGRIEITATSGYLNLINVVDEESYLAGVLKGEAGKNKPQSFYETMAIVSRTYLKFYNGRHKKEGFSICDQTHCQVYKGHTIYQPWIDAISSTDGIVLKNYNLDGYAEAVFHSNCGGLTASAKSVWKNDISICEVTTDSFCMNGRYANWNKHISMSKFKSTIGFTNQEIDQDSICRMIEFCHSGERPDEIILGKKSFSAVKMRSLFSLRSAWFDIECDKDSVVFSGKGYGHGVGLCQEGAIGMAKNNKSFTEILSYYFKQAAIVNEKYNIVLYRRAKEIDFRP